MTINQLIRTICIPVIALNCPVDVQIVISSTKKLDSQLNDWGIAQPLFSPPASQSEMKSHKNGRPGFKLTFDVATITLFAWSLSAFVFPSVSFYHLRAPASLGPFNPSLEPFDLAGLNLVLFTRHTSKQSLQLLTQTGKG